MIQVLRIGFIFAFLFSNAVFAGEPAPSPKPAVGVYDLIGDEVEATYFRKAMRAARDKRWDEVRGFYAGITSPPARDLVLWRLAIEDPDTDFFELKNAVETLRDWPRHNRIRLNAEKKIAKSGLEAEFIIQYFDAWPPIGGTGKLAFAHALYAGGFIVETQVQIRSAWRNHLLKRDEEREILKTFAEFLTPEDDSVRADTLIWDRHHQAAARMLSRLHGADRSLISARIKFMRGASDREAAARRVPETHKNDGGLLYERAYWQRRHGSTEKAIALVLRFPEGSYNAAAAKRMWTERRLLARRALKDGEFTKAYSLISHHGLSSGGNFAEGEWMAGWLALQKLQDPILALSHFERLKEGVSTPVSLARAYYWIGRAQQVLGHTEAMQMAWQKAARHDFTYYGQLASQNLGGVLLDLGTDPKPSPQQRVDFEGNRQIQALKLIGLSGNSYLFRTFSYHLDDQLPNAVDHVMLAKLARDMGQERAAMRAAKTALWRGEIIADSTWPVISMPDNLLAEPAFALALARQESELDPRAISHVGARGLMQLMPATARRTARASGRPYNKNWLTDDPYYNIRLGTDHLHELLEEFDGSYILAASAYNAGASRAYRWIKEYGDPRGEADPIDWVESIPFSETRNYVQRVMENVQVYRHRLAGAPTPITLMDDLKRGSKE